MSNEEHNTASSQTDVSGSLCAETRYRINLDRMKYELKELVDDCFSFDKDPEVSWKFFREQLKYYKQSQLLEWLNLDD